jgi:hypothetical protein
MKLTELKNWKKLSKKEQMRLEKIYSSELFITKTLYNKKGKENK